MVLFVLTDNDNGEGGQMLAEQMSKLELFLLSNVVKVLKEAGGLCSLLWDVTSLVWLSSGIDFEEKKI